MFKNSIKSPATLVQYNFQLKNFLKFSKQKTYDDIIALDNDRIHTILENYIMSLKEKGLKGATIRVRISAIELFLDMNRKVVYKKILAKMIPKDNEVPGGDIPLTNDELNRMLGSTKKLRSKALIHFLASTGIRPSGLVDPILRRKHIIEIEDCLAVKVYDMSKEGYFVFLTPEAKKTLNQYFESRKLNGEVLTPESPIFASEMLEEKFKPKNFPRKKKHEGYIPVKKENEHMTYPAIRHILLGVFKQAGISRVKTGQRYDKALAYSMRKRFNGILKMNNQVNSNIAEKLMAHRNGLDGTYLKPTMEQCFAEFKKAIIDLSIDSTERQKVQIKQKDSEISELKQKEELIKTNNQEIQLMREEIHDLKKDAQTTREFTRRISFTAHSTLEKLSKSEHLKGMSKSERFEIIWRPYMLMQNESLEEIEEFKKMWMMSRDY